RAARGGRPVGAQDSKGARADVRRTGSCGRRARRGGDWFSASQRAAQRPWCYFRGHDSGRASAGRFLRGGAHQHGPAAGGRQSSDPLPRIARGGDNDPEGRANAGLRTVTSATELHSEVELDGQLDLSWPASAVSGADHVENAEIETA